MRTTAAVYPLLLIAALAAAPSASLGQTKSEKPARPEESYPAAPNINAPLDKHRSTQGYASSSGVSSEDRTELSRGDRRFLHQALEPMDERLKIAKLAASRASHPAVKAFAERRVREQTETARTLEQLAVRKKFGLVKADKEERFEKLHDEKPESFDLQYVRAERKALEESAELYRDAAKQTADVDVRETSQRVANQLASSAAEAKKLESEISGNVK